MDPLAAWSHDYIAEHAYLVARGVRPLAIVDHVQGDDLALLRAATRLETVGLLATNAIPFVIRRRDGIADCGYAAAGWAVDLYRWLVTALGIPVEQEHRIRGLLLGYDPASIRAHDERTGGRHIRIAREP